MFLNKVAFIDGHLLQKGWKLDIKCLNAGCKKGQHETFGSNVLSASGSIKRQSEGTKEKIRCKKKKFATVF